MHVGQRGRFAPARCGDEFFQRLDDQLFALGDDTEKAPVAHRGDHAWQRIDRGKIDIDQFRVGRRWPCHAAVEHAGQHHVVHKARLACHLVRNVEALNRAADDMVRTGDFGCHQAGRFTIEQVVVGEVPVAGLLVGAAYAYHAVFHLEVGQRHFQPRRRGFEINRPRLGAGVAQRGARFLHRHAARGDLLVRAGGGAGGHHAHACKGQVEFFGGDLRQGGDDALADFDLAGVHRHAAVGVEFEPLPEAAVDVQAAGQLGDAGIHLRQFECEVHAAASERANLFIVCSCRRLAAFAFPSIPLRGALAGWLMPPPPCFPPRATPRARCGCGCRNGTGACRGLRAPRLRSVADSCPAAPRR